MSVISDFLAQSASYDSNPSFKFAEPGDTLDGTIATEPRIVDTDDINGGRSPKLVVDVTTTDGTYAVWLPAGKRITQAVSDAVRVAGADRLEVGGHLKLKHTGLGEQTKAGYNQPKLFKAQYTPPKPADLDEF